MELCPLENFHMKIVSAQQLKNRQTYFHESGYKNKLVSDNVQKTRTVTPPIFFVKLCPLKYFLLDFFLLYNNTLNDIFMKLGTNIKHHQRTCRKKEP